MREEGAGKREQGRGKMKLWLAGVIAVALGIAVWRFAEKDGEADSSPLRQGGERPSSGEVRLSGQAHSHALVEKDVSSLTSGKDAASPLNVGSDAGPQTEEERREAAEEKAVDAFDNLTDRWMEPAKKGVTMDDIDTFARSFRAIPKARQDECVHRALNLIPDENVMLLAGILMDKSMDKEMVETVYNDILNRDEDVKKPILQQIFKDKSHPCWADTAWILDVTGELPKSK